MDVRKSGLKEVFDDKDIGKVLDVGTGRGNFVEVLAECFDEKTRLVGIDTYSQAIESAKENFKRENIEFLCMNAANMEFNDNSFDVVCISNTLHHLSNMREVLKEMKRVLKPNGYFIINEMFCDNQSQIQLSHVKLHHLGGEIDMVLGDFHDKTFKKEKIIDIVKELELDIVKTFEYSTHDEQMTNRNKEDEKESLDLWFDALSKRIEKMKDLSQQRKYKKLIAELSAELYDIGFFLATEVIVIGQYLE